MLLVAWQTLLSFGTRKTCLASSKSIQQDRFRSSVPRSLATEARQNDEILSSTALDSSIEICFASFMASCYLFLLFHPVPQNPPVALAAETPRKSECLTQVDLPRGDFALLLSRRTILQRFMTKRFFTVLHSRKLTWQWRARPRFRKTMNSTTNRWCHPLPC